MISMNALAVLEGSWKGGGRGSYPTIAAFEFSEETCFTLAPQYPLLRYEQKTVLVPEHKASHWEVGFIRPVDDGFVEISTAQDSGRVEVLRGRIEVLELSGLRLDLKSKQLANDARLVETERIITVRGDLLHYITYMITTTTDTPSRAQHLEASLRRVAG